MYFHIINWTLKCLIVAELKTLHLNMFFSVFAIFPGYLYLMRPAPVQFSFDLLCRYQNLKIFLFEDQILVFRNISIPKLSFGCKILTARTSLLHLPSLVTSVTRKLRDGQDRFGTLKPTDTGWFLSHLPAGKWVFLACSNYGWKLFLFIRSKNSDREFINYLTVAS